MPRHSLNYIPSLCIIITLGWNITVPARRREEGTYGDVGEDEGKAGGSLGESAEDGRDVLVHVEPWSRIGSCSTTSTVPSSWPYLVTYSCEYQKFSPEMIYIIHQVSHMQSLLCAKSIDNIKQPSWFAQPFAKLVQPPTSLMRLVWETWSELGLNLCLWVDNTYIGQTWFELGHVYEKLVRFVVFMRYVVSTMYVMILWTLWWLCDICFVCLDEIIKTDF
jgi:hypothetical protein